MAETQIWGIHAGVQGEADSFVLKNNQIVLGWPKFGDLSKFKTREEFKKHYKVTYPDDKPGAIPLNAGQLYRFVHEANEDDLVVYPSKHSRTIHIGKVVGPYKYQPQLNSRYPNHRKVEWIKEIPRTHFSQGALYESGSAMSFFQIKNYAEEFQNALTGNSIAPPVEKDPGIPSLSEAAEQTITDFILKTLSQELKGIPLEDFVAHLLTRMGYQTRKTVPGTPGVDIIAHEDELGFKSPIIKVQVKSTDGNVGYKDVSALSGEVGQGEFGLIVSLGEFTRDAVDVTKKRQNIRLINGVELVELILKHYDSLDARYKGLIPLKRVYLPEAVERQEG